MGANYPGAGAIFDPRGQIGRIFKEDHYTLLHTKYESSGPCGLREKKLFYVFPRCPWGVACMDQSSGPCGFGKEDFFYVFPMTPLGHYTLLHTKYDSSGPCGFGEEDFFMFCP